ncbi:MAG: PhnD/SsuA/transferrin family substrate-binding protein [Candidatus Thiodiazotropha sp.]
MKHRAVFFLLLSTCLFISATVAETASLPERYKDNPSIGYFGRMSKILFDANVTDTTIATDMIIRNVFGMMDMKSEIKIYDDRNNLISDLYENRVDAVFTNVIDHFELEHLIDPEHIYTLIYGSSAEQKIYLLTRKKDNIRNLRDLQEKTISIPNGHYLGRLFLDVELRKSRLPGLESFFSGIESTIDTNTAVVNLFFGKNDCALVSDIAFELAVELNNQIFQDLEVLIASKNMVPQIIAINKNVPDSIYQRVDDFLVRAHENRRIKHLLTLFRAKKFIKLEQSQLNESRRLVDEYKTLTRLPGTAEQ